VRSDQLRSAVTRLDPERSVQTDPEQYVSTKVQPSR